MKKSRHTKIGQLLLILFFNLIFFIVNAQKLPNKQEASLRAPDSIKIDGQATEWNDQYQAYNKATEVFYSIANDDDNLYLIIHAVKSRIIEKMMEGGISFTVSPANKKDEGKKVTVLFPLLTMPTSWAVLHNAGKTLTETQAPLFDDKYGVYRNKDSVLKAKPTTSIGLSNKTLTISSKEIKVSGINPITDEITITNPKSTYYRGLPLHAHPFKLIPVNNHEGIKAMTQLDEKGEYTYELALPIKYLGLSVNDPQKFSYYITFNSRSEDQRFGTTVGYGLSPGGSWGLKDIDLNAPTDFWSEYILAKK